MSGDTSRTSAEPLNSTRAVVSSCSPSAPAVSAVTVAHPSAGTGPAVGVWRVARDGKLLATTQLADAEALTFPALTAMANRITLFHLQSAGAGGGETLARTSWVGADLFPLVEIVDDATVERYDVAATAVGLDTAHVFAAMDGGLRVSVSTTDLANAGTTTLDTGEYGFADISGGDGASAVAVLRFDGGESFHYRLHPDGQGWVDVGHLEEVDWVQLVRTPGGVTVVRQLVGGALELADGSASGLAAWAPVWEPSLGAKRKDFDLVLPGAEPLPRLLTRGVDSSGEGMRLRISIPQA